MKVQMSKSKPHMGLLRNLKQNTVKQGGVLGSPMCSASTAEYCEKNKGVSVGSTTVATLAFVDDMIDISMSCDDAVSAHVEAVQFGKLKKLKYSPGKCKSMTIRNTRKKIESPELYIQEEKIENADSVKYLGRCTYLISNVTTQI